MSKLSKRGKVSRAHIRVRKKVCGCSERPRLSVYRSGQNIYAQIIDDEKEITLVAASSVDKELKKSEKLKSGANCLAAQLVGKLIAKRALEKKISQVVFDRGGVLFHGRVKALAEAAREAGLEF